MLIKNAMTIITPMFLAVRFQDEQQRGEPANKRTEAVLLLGKLRPLVGPVRLQAGWPAGQSAGQRSQRRGIACTFWAGR